MICGVTAHITKAALFLLLPALTLQALTTSQYVRQELDHLQFPNDLLFVKVGRSHLHCAHLCASLSQCSSFTFSKADATSMCRGHGAAALNMKTAVASPGARTYERRGRSVGQGWARSPAAAPLRPSSHHLVSPLPWTTSASSPRSHFPPPSSTSATATTTTTARDRPFPPWVRATCAWSGHCLADSGAQCYRGRCLCPPGVYYSWSRDACVPACPEPSLSPTTFLGPYPATEVSGHFLQLHNDQEALASCLTLCLQHPACRAVDHAPTQGWCDLLGNDNSSANFSVDVESPEFQYHQRTCL